MKVLQKKIIWCIVFGIMGIAISLFTLKDGQLRASYIGIGMGLVGAMGGKLFSLFRILKNPEKAREYGISQGDERNLSIAEKSSRFTFFITYLGLFCGIFLGVFMGQPELVNILSAILAVEAVIYLGTFYVLSKKY